MSVVNMTREKLKVRIYLEKVSKIGDFALFQKANLVPE